MEVPALCIRLVMAVVLLLVAQFDFSYAQEADSAFPRVDPDRQQHFQFERVVVSCEGLQGLTGWRVMKKIRGDTTTCALAWSTSAGPCEINNPYVEFDSGAYWCVMGAKKSSTVNITVTAAPVILESPVHPVKVGDDVTLRCRKKPTSSFIAEFFKDGHLMENISSTGNLTIHRVSQSDEGLYKCSVSGAGQSAESWLAVRAASERPPQSPQLTLLLSAGVGVFLVVPLLLVGLLRCRKRQPIATEAASYHSSFESFSSPQAAPEEARAANPDQGTYATVAKYRRVEDNEDPFFMPVYHTLSLGTA